MEKEQAIDQVIETFGEERVLEHISEPALIHRTARLLAKRAGRKKIMRTCEYCGGVFGTRELRQHTPRCEKRGPEI